LVDQFYIFNTNDELKEIIQRASPDYIVKGSDWKGNVVGQEFAKEIVFYPLNKSISSTIIANRVKLKHIQAQLKQYEKVSHK
jgi:bifunctional ADP-heptose synthase (sugar kinase/adenylyltransferase)